MIITAYELLYMPDIPEKVALSEGVDISKLYGGEKSAGFVNGVLSSINKKYGRASEN
jgi:N utilization substance protein B